ncbi:DNA polymerase IV [Paenibacillus sp. GYB003]|uniref:DNA polymerase IV n=1 Tax=Paenibacillus sp. GYB003 TaxID=2994392 RepID=UPI002F962D2A
MKLSNKVIILADCQSFYASCEKAERPELQDKPVVVAGSPETRSGIILAACPVAKRFGVTTAETIRETLAKCPDLTIIKPRMRHYINVSLKISEIYERYSDLVEPFSIDEQFVDISSSLSLFGEPEQIAKAIQNQVWAETKVWVRVGISSNKVISKMACDHFAKKNETGIYTLRKEELPEKLWPLSIEKMFMVGSQMTRHLTRMGLYTIGDLARLELYDFKRKMRYQMGKNADIHAEMLWKIANGYDDSPVSPFTFSAQQKGIGHMMTLPYDLHTIEEIKVCLHELSQWVCERCRSKGLMGWVASVGCQGADFDRPTGFHRQMRMPYTTNLSAEVYDVVSLLFERHWNGLPVRKLAVSLSDLTTDEVYQMPMFPTDRERKITLEKTTDEIKQRFGSAAIMRASSITPSGQAKRRSKMIGGHSK